MTRNTNPTFEIVPSATIDQAQIDSVVKIVLDSVQSVHTRLAYGRALTNFVTYLAQAKRPLNRALVRAYIAELRDKDVSRSSLNQQMSAIRTLVRELQENGVLDPVIAQGIISIKGLPQRGERLGTWLTLDSAQNLLRQPDLTTVKGVRDKAILSILLGCGLRREELTGLTPLHFQQREERWLIVNLVGKREKLRSVPMAAWCYQALVHWLTILKTTSLYQETNPIFYPVNRGGNLSPVPLTPQGVHKIVREYAKKIGYPTLAPHDLRRTFAKLAHKGGSPVDQIGLSLGHDSIETTQRYLGIDQDMQDTPSDRLGLNL